ncbi:MAG: hypothetical protein JXB30_02595 [Anaerolineae bacterium]|nr:hypothetical protein [Anaerolineae bacterium]
MVSSSVFSGYYYETRSKKYTDFRQHDYWTCEQCHKLHDNILPNMWRIWIPIGSMVVAAILLGILSTQSEKSDWGCIPVGSVGIGIGVWFLFNERAKGRSVMDKLHAKARKERRTSEDGAFGSFTPDDYKSMMRLSHPNVKL